MSLVGIYPGRASPEPRIDPRLWLSTYMKENMHCRVLTAKNWLFEPCSACSLLVLTQMHQLQTLLFVFHKNQQENTLFQGSPELFSPSVKGRALGWRLTQTQRRCTMDHYHSLLCWEPSSSVSKISLPLVIERKGQSQINSSCNPQCSK